MKKSAILPSALSLSLLIAAGCGDKSKTATNTPEMVEVDSITPKTLSISVKNAKPLGVNLERIATISLDDNTENIMGIPQAVEVRGDTIFAVESIQSPGVFAYLSDGSQLWAYCTEGGAEEDISSPFNFSVGDQYVAAYDRSGMKIGVLDKSGKFVKSIPVDPMAVSAILDPSGGIWSDYSNQHHGDTMLSFRATPDEQETEVLPVPELLQGMTTVEVRSLTPLYDGSINYLPAMQPRVYSLRSGKAQVKYELDFGGLWPDDETIEKEYAGNSWARKIRNFPINLLKVEENEKWVAVSFLNEDKNYVYIHNKATDKGTTYVDASDEYFTTADIADDALYLLSKDNDIVALRCK